MQISNRFSRVRLALNKVTTPVPVSEFLETHQITKSSLVGGVSKYKVGGEKVKFGYTEEGVHVIYRYIPEETVSTEVEVQS
jgi:hypothetical protein